MPEINETPLPGVGARFDFACVAGRRIGVIARPSGRRELLVYGVRDPDAVEVSVELSEAESESLADLLGGTAVTREIRSVVQEIEGLVIDWLTLPSSFAARTIGDTELRRRSGVSIIALVRAGVTQPAPGPDERLEPGDVLVLTGTAEGIGAAEQALGIA